MTSPPHTSPHTALGGPAGRTGVEPVLSGNSKAARNCSCGLGHSCPTPAALLTPLSPPSLGSWELLARTVTLGKELGQVLPTVHGEPLEMTADSDRPHLDLGMSLVGWESPPPPYSHCRFPSPAGQQALPFPSPLSTPARTDAFQAGLALAGTPGLRSRPSSICTQRHPTPASDHASRPSPKVSICSVDPLASGWFLRFEERTGTRAGPRGEPGLGHSPEPLLG